MHRLDEFINAPKYEHNPDAPDCKTCGTNEYVFLKKSWILGGSKSKLRGDAQGVDMTTFLWKCSNCGKHRRTYST